MSGRPTSRRAVALSVLSGGCLLWLLAASFSSSPVLPSRLADTLSSYSTSSPSLLSTAAFLSHHSELAALPLVSSIASFSLSSPSSNASVAICAVPTHEERYLPEWITWHRLLGVERFFLFDNAPTLEMRRLLRPWIEEGSVVLYELEYDESVNIGTVYQQHVLRLCEKHVLPHVKWASHHDVDEFLMVDAAGWSPSSPSPSSSLPSPSSSSAADEPAPTPFSSSDWSFPLHDRFDSLLDEATCMPMLRLPFHNYGVREMDGGKLVTDVHSVRDNLPPNYHTYGKIFLHSDETLLRAAWMGPHSCKSLPDTVIMDAQGKEIRFERGTYPYAGVPLPQEGIYLNHYIQRSLADCYSKFHVLSSTPQDWRTQDGLAGCARNYIPSDAELSSPSFRAALEAEPQGAELVSRPESWKTLLMRDERARESWQGKMTRAILEEWGRRKGKGLGTGGKGWYWEDEASEERLMSLPVEEVGNVVQEIKGMR
ncbi:hypothetical protein JCM8547_002139 [Rhodosporidiobolus lusitaniae]